MKNALKVLLGTLVLALAGAVYATVTINGDACGELSGNVTISATGDVIITTNSDLCGYNRGSGGGEDPPPVVTYNLTIAASNGTVARSLAGTGCGSGCFTYNDGQSVTLTANPNSGYTFAGWSGSCSNTSGNCIVSMTAARSVTANFTPVVVNNDCPAAPGNVVIESFPSQLTAVEYSANTILAMPLPKSGGKLMAFKNNLSSSSTRYMVISTCPGDTSASGKSRSCYASGSENATVWFSGNGSSGCDISGNETYYVNVSHFSTFGARLGCTSKTCGYSLAP